MCHLVLVISFIITLIVKYNVNNNGSHSIGYISLVEPVSNPCFTSFIYNEIVFNQITTNIFLKAYKALLDKPNSKEINL